MCSLLPPTPVAKANEVGKTVERSHELGQLYLSKSKNKGRFPDSSCVLEVNKMLLLSNTFREPMLTSLTAVSHTKLSECHHQPPKNESLYSKSYRTTSHRRRKILTWKKLLAFLQLAPSINFNSPQLQIPTCPHT